MVVNWLLLATNSRTPSKIEFGYPFGIWNLGFFNHRTLNSELCILSWNLSFVYGLFDLPFPLQRADLIIKQHKILPKNDICHSIAGPSLSLLRC